MNKLSLRDWSVFIRHDTWASMMQHINQPATHTHTHTDWLVLSCPRDASKIKSYAHTLHLNEDYTPGLASQAN